MISVNITKRLDAQKSLTLKLEIAKGAFVAIMGESGAGKTTLLRILAGLEPSEGSISVEGKAWQDLPPQKREIGFVFQDYALFSHMSVEENLLFVSDDRGLAEELLEASGLSELRGRSVRQLSGGQKQRVSLCRAMMRQPKILLLDEPLSALDTQTRSKLYRLITSWHKRFGMTTLMVSHDIQDVLALASRVVSLEAGKIVSDIPVESLLSSQSERHSAEVLALSQRGEQSMASLVLAGVAMEIAVSAEVRVGEILSFSLNPRVEI